MINQIPSDYKNKLRDFLEFCFFLIIYRFDKDFFLISCLVICNF